MIIILISVKTKNRLFFSPKKDIAGPKIINGPKAILLSGRICFVNKSNSAAPTIAPIQKPKWQ